MDKIIQNYYGNRNKPTYKPGGGAQSNKHYCAVCKIEIAPSRTTVMFHESSKQHLENVREALYRTKSTGRGGFY